MGKVNLAAAFAGFSEHWSPRVAGEVNDNYVKLAKLKGEFVWHHREDELFLVVSGRLIMRFAERDVELLPGEFIVVPRGVSHLPVAPEECEILLLEPKTTLNTGNVVNERTVAELQHIQAERNREAAGRTHPPRSGERGGRGPTSVRPLDRECVALRHYSHRPPRIGASVRGPGRSPAAPPLSWPPFPPPWWPVRYRPSARAAAVSRPGIPDCTRSRKSPGKRPAPSVHETS